MKNLLYLLVFFLFVSCSVKKSENGITPKRVVISGKILNPKPDKKIISLFVNRSGFNSKQVDSEPDSLGNFSLSFESYIPTDVRLTYNINILILTHPGDSIYLKFDGKKYDRPEILKTVKFSSDAVKTNREATAFQMMYYSSPLYPDWDSKRRAVKEYGLDQFVLYLDTLKQKGRQLYEQFVEEISPGKEAKIWALTFIEGEYFDILSFYPPDHQITNNLKSNQWIVPVSFFYPLAERMPITKEMLISGYAMSNFVNQFFSCYTSNIIWEEEANKKYKIPSGWIIAPPDVIDSITIFGIIKYTPDTLLRQLVLTEMFRRNFNAMKIEVFEKYRDVVDLYIKEPFLKEPLLELYEQLKNRITNPELATNAILKKLDSSSINQIFDTIFQTNQGKVIYVDCWATWCGPCKSEMPNSKRLMEQMEGKDVGFVYLCLESEEKLWKTCLDEFKLGGQHYLLTQKQSSDLRKIFNVPEIPHYFLFDKKGMLIEKGSHLRPDHAKGKIEELMKK